MRRISDDRTNTVLLLFVLLVGCFLRLWSLINHSFWPWYDELYTIHYVFHSSSPIAIYKTYFSNYETNPILHSTLLFYYTKLFGTTILAFKSFSVVCGILVLVSTYHIVKKLLSVEHAIICVACVALSRFPLYLSQESRPYMLYFLGSIWFFYFLYQVYEGKELTASLLIKLYISTFVLANSHFVGLIIATLMFGFVILRSKIGINKKLLFIFLFMLINVFSIVQVCHILLHSFMGQATPGGLIWMDKYSWRTNSILFPFLVFIDLFLRGAGNAPVWSYNRWSQYSYVVLMFFFIVFGFLFYRQKRKNKLLGFIMIYALFSFCFLWLCSVVSINLVAKLKIFIYLFFPMSILISIGVCKFSSKISKLVSKPVVTMLFILITFLLVTDKFMYEKQFTYYKTLDLGRALMFISDSTKQATLYMPCESKVCSLPYRFFYTYRDILLQDDNNVIVMDDLENIKTNKLFVMVCNDVPEDQLKYINAHYNKLNTVRFEPCLLDIYKSKVKKRGLRVTL